MTDYYAPECERGVRWNDPDVAIDWPIAAGEAMLSPKDARLPRLAELPQYFRYDSEMEVSLRAPATL